MTKDKDLGVLIDGPGFVPDLSPEQKAKAMNFVLARDDAAGVDRTQTREVLEMLGLIDYVPGKPDVSHLAKIERPPRALDRDAFGFTTREREILEAVLDDGPEEAARKLGVTSFTVYRHLRRMRRHHEVNETADLARIIRRPRA